MLEAIERPRPLGLHIRRRNEPQPVAPTPITRLIDELNRLDESAASDLSENYLRCIEKAVNVLRSARLHRQRGATPIGGEVSERKPRASSSRMERIRLELLAADPACAYCGNPLTKKGASLDHVIPESRGGSSLPHNFVLACSACNGSKSNRTPQEWADAILAVAERKIGGAA